MNSTLQIIIYFLLILAITKPVGLFIYNVLEGKKNFLTPIFGWLEKIIYKIFGTTPEDEMNWKQYTVGMLIFSFIASAISYGLMRFQGFLPWNPQHYTDAQMPAHLAFNTAASFATNTDWQSYTPEQTLSYFSNMVTLAFHNWASAAVGISLAVAIIRGFARQGTNSLGNFWVDCTRVTIYILFPISLIGGLVYLYQGVPMNFNPYLLVHTVEGAKQTIAMGPVASQEIIKNFGTNGGGFFNANGAHPFENPTPFSNLFTMFLIFVLPAGITYTFGKMVGNSKQGWSIFAAMSFLFLLGAGICTYAEQQSTPQYTSLNVDQLASAKQPGGNMEGKEMRFGIGSSALFATITTDASCGAVNSMHDSYTPIGGMVPLFNLLTGEVIFGGAGAGMYGILIYAILAVFIAGLMVGRTPEYLGKKIGRFEVQMATLALLVLAADVLGFTALSLNTKFTNDPGAKDRYASVTITDKNKGDVSKMGPYAYANFLPGAAYGGSDEFYGSTVNNTNNSGAHGFSEVFYAYSSTTGNNGSAFAGLTANTPYYNITLGISLLIGRFLMIVPLMAMAGSLIKKKKVEASSGTFLTDNATFAGLLVGTIIIIGALTFFPALALGPIVEHLQMLAHKLF